LLALIIHPPRVAETSPVPSCWTPALSRSGKATRRAPMSAPRLAATIHFVYQHPPCSPACERNRRLHRVPMPAPRHHHYPPFDLGETRGQMVRSSPRKRGCRKVRHSPTPRSSHFPFFRCARAKLQGGCSDRTRPCHRRMYSRPAAWRNHGASKLFSFLFSVFEENRHSCRLRSGWCENHIRRTIDRSPHLLITGGALRDRC
jgi:hypothetical protein